MISSKRATKSCRVLGSMRLRAFFVLVLVLVLPLFAVTARADILGTAAPYAVLATASVTNAGAGVLGATKITGDMGSGGPIGSCTGFVEAPSPCTAGPGMVSGAVNVAGAVTGPLADFGTAYTSLANTPGAASETGQVLGNGVGGTLPSLGPGVYSFATTADSRWRGRRRSALDLPDRDGIHCRSLLFYCSDRCRCGFRRYIF
jgi:hypothetical protein